ncbi:MAG: ABC transporter substrate-binding protein [Candidatus Riflebacteria bacterium]|nr:ABC transporter substrate-binding protein [Candidatus Riflebacteria bacterium]
MNNTKRSGIAFVVITILCFLIPSQASAKSRIVSLLPSLTELLCELGYSDQIVAVTTLCNYPAEIASQARIGAMELDLEKIVGLKPDYIFDLNRAHEKYRTIFEQFKIKYIDLQLIKIDEIPQAAVLLSSTLGNPEKGVKFADEWKKKISDLQKVVPSPRKVYVEIWDSPIQAAGGTSFINDLVKIAGGKNIFEHTESPFPLVSMEKVITENPDVIILAYPAQDPLSISSRPGWQNIPAVKSKSIFKVDPDIFTRPGPRCLKAIEILVKILDSEK